MSIQYTKHNDSVDGEAATSSKNNSVRDKVLSGSSCDECGGQLVESDGSGEVVCDSCGLVADTDRIDYGPEWRNFGSDSESNSRVGQQQTMLLHDKGLSTEISWQNRDGKGNILSDSQRKRIQRLREKNAWSKVGGKTQTLKFGLGEVLRISSAVGLPKHVRETAGVLFRRAQTEGLLCSRVVEYFAGACVYASSRQCGCPRTLEQIKSVCRDVDNNRARKYDLAVGRDYRFLCDELGLEIEPNHPTDFLSRLVSEIDTEIPPTVVEQAHMFIDDLQGANLHSGVKPISIAAAALFCACQYSGVDVSQRDIADICEVCCNTIQDRYQDIIKVTDIDRTEIVDEWRLD
jgi:transcription initiation factor TFIIB